jgi:hypothetical protein
MSTKRVTIKKEGSHYVVSVGGKGMTLAFTKSEALDKQKAFREQIKRKRS